MINPKPYQIWVVTESKAQLSEVLLLDEEKRSYRLGVGITPRPVTYCVESRLNSQSIESSNDDYNQAIQLKPNLADAYYNRGNTKIRLGRINEARQNFKKARDLAYEAGNASLIALAEQRLRKLDNQEGE